MLSSKKLLIIGLVWPEPTSSAAGSRMVQLVQLFLDWGCEVTFVSAAAKSEHSFDLEALSVKTQSVQLNDTSFDGLVSELQPDIVLFDRYISEEQFGWRVEEQCPNALRVLDTEDLHCLRLARQEAHKKQIPFDEIDIQTDTAKREIASIYRCDLSLMISKFEMELLQKQFQVPSQQLYYLPFLVDEITPKIQQGWKPYESRQDFVFIGNFWHEPNWDAVRYLKESIWIPIAQALPEVKLHIYGAYTSDKVRQLHNPAERFLVHGRAESAFEVIENAKVLLAPLRFGAGAKGKLLEAMQCGTPSVTTKLGAESMSNDLEWNGIVTDEIDLFVKGAVDLYKNKEQWTKAQSNGIEIVNTNYNKTLFVSQFKSKVEKLQAIINQHRQTNFVGQMLQHHTAKSSKYLSKWIEEKNK